MPTTSIGPLFLAINLWPSEGETEVSRIRERQGSIQPPRRYGDSELSTFYIKKAGSSTKLEGLIYISYEIGGPHRLPGSAFAFVARNHL
jgi:hypothetical protein